MKKISVMGLCLFFLLVVLAVPIFAAKEGPVPTQQPGLSASALEPVKISLAKLGGYLPKLGGLLLILVVGALIAVGITVVIGKLLEIIRLEKGAKKIKLPEILKKGGIGLTLSELITEIIFFLIIIVTLITALEYYGVATVPLSGQLLAYVPQAIAAVFILVAGILLAILISGIINLVGGNVKIAQTSTLAGIAKYAIIIVSSLIALRELGLGVIVTDKSKDIIFAGLVLSLVLAFGLGAKEKAAKFLNKIFKE